MALMQENGAILTEYSLYPKPGHFGAFMPAMRAMLTQSECSLQDIKALIVAIGPGSFTGLRIGLSAAKGMAHSLKIPIIGVSGLEAMANQIPYTHYPICPLLESRKGDVFTALFRWNDDHKMVRIREDTCLKTIELPSYINGKTLFLGNNFNNQGPMISEMLGEKALLVPPHLWNLRASAVGISGLKRFLDQDFDHLQDLVPSYLRPPDIRPNPFGPPLKEKDTKR